MRLPPQNWTVNTVHVYGQVECVFSLCTRQHANFATHSCCCLFSWHNQNIYISNSIITQSQHGAAGRMCFLIVCRERRQRLCGSPFGHAANRSAVWAQCVATWRFVRPTGVCWETTPRMEFTDSLCIFCRWKYVFKCIDTMHIRVNTYVALLHCVRFICKINYVNAP